MIEETEVAFIQMDNLYTFSDGFTPSPLWWPTREDAIIAGFARYPNRSEITIIPYSNDGEWESVKREVDPESDNLDLRGTSPS